MSDKIIGNWNNQYPLNNCRQSFKTKVNLQQCKFIILQRKLIRLHRCIKYIYLFENVSP